jgi:hypothetical protein
MKGIIQINTKYRKLHSFDNIYCENILKQKSSSDFLKSSRKYSDMSYLHLNPALTTSGTYQSMLMKVARNAIRKVPEAVL